MTEPNGVAPSPAPAAPAATGDAAKASNPVPATNIPAAKPAGAGAEPSDPNSDPNASLRPRDSRTIHLMLANLGITSYQERVPLALMDAAYRYTSGIIQEALLYSDINSNTTNPNAHASTISLADLRMAIWSRVNHQFITAPPKDFLLDIAHERNKIALPPVKREWGVRLPPEQYCLTGVNWDLVLNEEDEEVEDEEEGNDKPMNEEADQDMPDAVAGFFSGSGEDDAEGDRDMSG